MSYLVKSVVLCIILQIHFTYGQIGCSLSYKTDLSDKEPILLTNSKFGYNLFEPTTSELKISKNDEITIACPGANNKINGGKKDVVSAKCVGVKTVAIDGKQLEFSKISCDRKATGSYLDTSEPCGKRGIKKYIGHKINDKFYPRFHVCYDQKNGQTLYSKHLLQGASVNFDKQVKPESNFKVAGLEFRVKPEQIYKPENLKKIFTNTLGTPQLADQYINAKSTLVKSQLSPKSDFVLTTSQYVPYFYVNTIPQWSSINSGNWKTLEETIRKYSSSTRENLKIITGTFDVLTLKNKNNIETKIYLDEHQTLPIPKYIWKIVYSPNTKKAIAFVNYNNPFAKPNDNLCSDICDKNGWGNALFKQLDKGIIYCCDVKQFMDKVKTVPNVGDIAGILDGKIGKPAVPPKPTTGCIINYKTDFPEKDPLILKQNGQNYEPILLNEALYLAPNQDLWLYCTGSSNKISKLNKNSVQAKCVQGSQLKIDNKNYNFKELGCTNKVASEYRVSKQECMGSPTSTLSLQKNQINM